MNSSQDASMCFLPCVSSSQPFACSLPPLVRSSPTSPPKSGNRPAVILDFDDTLFFSSSMSEKYERITYDELASAKVYFKDILPRYSEALIKLLTKIEALGDICIVTNATDEWVHRCVSVLFPETVYLFKKIPIFSARNFFEMFCGQEIFRKLYPNPAIIPTTAHWKEVVFYHLRSIATPALQTVVSIGDSTDEWNASGRVFDNGRIRIKFINNPSPEDLIEQFGRLEREIEHLLTLPGNTDVIFREVVVPPPKASRSRTPSPSRDEPEPPAAPRKVRPNGLYMHRVPQHSSEAVSLDVLPNPSHPRKRSLTPEPRTPSHTPPDAPKKPKPSGESLSD